MRKLIEPSEARQHIVAHLPRIPVITCPLKKAAGRVLREAIVADRDFPPFNRSMMDGYALRAKEVVPDAIFKIVDTAPAGTTITCNHTSTNSCIEIMTGAILPNGADCVVPYEATTKVAADRIRIIDQEPIRRGDFVHHQGSDLLCGNVLLEPGCMIGSRESAAAATCGYHELKVSKLPSIAIACSGDELVDVDQQPEANQIRRSNDTCIETALKRLQIKAAECTHLPDAPDTTLTRLKSLIAKNDFVIVSGGISMGQKDFIPGLLGKLGLTCHFHGVAQRPGKPMGYWTNSNCAVFALPGNPLSTLTCLHHYVIPAIRKAMGLTSPLRTQPLTLTASETKRKDLTVFLPVNLRPDNKATPCPPQNSGDLVRILQSDGYVVIPSDEIEADPCRTYLFHPWH